MDFRQLTQLRPLVAAAGGRPDAEVFDLDSGFPELSGDVVQDVDCVVTDLLKLF